MYSIKKKCIHSLSIYCLYYHETARFQEQKNHKSLGNALYSKW